MNQEKINSLQWAIDELSKQKEEFTSMLEVAQKREETSSLIEEVNAQKDALENRISSLKDGLLATTKLVDQPVDKLTAELSNIDDKLEIALDRLNNLEQEEYLEELGRKLNGDTSIPNYSEEKESIISVDSIDRSIETQSVNILPNPKNIETQRKSPQTSVSATPVLMKSPSNRIETEDEKMEDSGSNISEPEVFHEELSLETCSSVTFQSLESCAKELGMEPEFLLNKGMQAVLRMIARNGNKVSFPLELDQIEKS